MAVTNGGIGKRKKLGQHFLKDPEVVERIVTASGVRPGDQVLEIGPGRGILTKALLKAGADLLCVEIDEYLYNALCDELGGKGNLTLVKQNALYYEFPEAFMNYKIVSNLPYSVSVPLVKRFIEQGTKVESMTLMTQEEVGRRLTAKAGEKHYGSLSVFVEYHCETEFLFAVPSGSFSPPPKVSSSVISFKPRLTPPVKVSDKESFFEFVKTAFVHRRKTIRNNLKKQWIGDTDFEEACDIAGLDPTSRPQEISIGKFATLFGIASLAK